jgi:hypothetical protein
MSPFRKYFADRGSDHPVAYSLLTLAAGAFACMVISVVISVGMGNRAIRQNEAQEAQERARAATAAERNRQAVCLLIDKMSAVYNEDTEPVTDSGKAAGRAWQDLHTIFRCNER